MNKTDILTVRDLVVHLPTREGVVQAVDGVSLAVAPGTTIGIVGESGCGKSMLARSIMGLLPARASVSPQSEIHFKNLALRRLSPRRLRSIIGKEMAMVFQDPMSTLNPVMQIGHQIAEGILQHERLTMGEAIRRAADMLETVGIDRPEQRLKQYPHQLSGGQRQRVAIAIALSCSPKLLIADEPTTALDVTVQAEILDLLKRHCTAGTMAMLLISHDLSVVAGRTNETAVMYAGQIVELAPTAQLFRNARMPYTRALLSAMPLLSKPAHRDLASIKGHPPDLIDPPTGCRFQPRCPRGRSECRSTPPPFTRRKETPYGYACWYPLGRSD